MRNKLLVNFTGVRKIGQGIIISILMINVVTPSFSSCMSTLLIPFDKSLQVISKLCPLALFPLKAHRFRTLDLICFKHGALWKSLFWD